MILDVDIGNTNTKWRLRTASGDKFGRLPVNAIQTLAEQIAAQETLITRVRASCVAGRSAQQLFSDWSRQVLGVEPQFAKVQSECEGLIVGYEHPQKMGVDRWLAMLAARRRLQAAAGDCGFIVVSAGSAITADFVDSQGQHAGGLILPGLSMMRQSLFARTDAVKVDSLTVPQTWAPGRDTLACVENAAASAMSGWVREIICYGENLLGDGLALFVCGGDADVIASRDPRFAIQPDLIFDGLAVALG